MSMRFQNEKKATALAAILVLFMAVGAPLNGAFAAQAPGDEIPPGTVNWIDDHTLVVRNFSVNEYIIPVQTPEGGFILSGMEPLWNWYSGDASEVHEHIFIAHITLEGELAYFAKEKENPSWSQEFPEVPPFNTKGLLPVGDDTYEFGEDVRSKGSLAYARRVNPEGKVLWNYQRKFSDYSSFDYGVVTPDGGLLVVGNSYKTTWEGTERVVAARFNGKGKVLWTKHHAFGEYKQGKFLTVAAVDSGYLVVGHENDGSSKFQNKLIFLLWNEKGKVIRQWTELINPLGKITAVSLHHTPRGLCLIAADEKDTVIRWYDSNDDGNDGGGGDGGNDDNGDRTGVYPGMFTGGWEAKSAILNQRMATRTGPGTKFTEDHGTLPKDTEIVVYAQEIGGSANWALVEFVKNGKLIRAYTGVKRIDADFGAIPTTTRNPESATITTDTTAYYGPGEEYLELKGQAKKGKKVQVYGIDRGFALIEYVVGDSWMRSWVPEECLAFE